MRIVLKWLPLALLAVGTAIWLAGFGGDGAFPAGKIAFAWMAVVALLAGSIAGVVYDRKAAR